MDLDTEIWAVSTDCYLDFGPSKPDGTMKFHQAMFLSCKQALKNISLNYYKGHMDKTKGEGGDGGGKWVQLGWGGGMGRKGIQL